MFSVFRMSLLRSAHSATNTMKCKFARQVLGVLQFQSIDISPKSCCGQVNMHLPFRNFHITSQAKLRTLFSEEDQEKITTFINKIEMPEKKLNGKLRSLKKIVASRPENGPLRNIDDLLEKYSLTSTAAVSLCYAVLKSSENPEQSVHQTMQKRRSSSRKLNNLKKAVNPDIRNPTSISKFAAVTVTENYISFMQIERLELDWKTQLLVDWNALHVSNLSLTDVILKLWRMLPSEEYYVVYGIPTRGAFQNQNRCYGALLSLMCTRKDFNEDVNQKIFHVTGRAPARQFNFIVGNEFVSPQNMVTTKVEGKEVSTPDDHVFNRSLNEVTISHTASIKYSAFDDDMRESLCQSFLLGKAFVELLKEP